MYLIVGRTFPTGHRDIAADGRESPGASFDADLSKTLAEEIEEMREKDRELDSSRDQAVGLHKARAIVQGPRVDRPVRP